MAGLKRSPLVRTNTIARTSVKLPKCAAPGCRVRFVPMRRAQVVCGPDCGALFTRLIREKEERKQAKAEKARDKERREALKTIPQLIAEAQFAFNAFIRLRDQRAGHACICCGKPLEWGKIGGAVDAGHWRSTGSASHLRFHEDNCHAQRADCNRYGAGRAVDYRIGLVSRIGIERLTALETSNEVNKWSRERLIEIRDTYRRKKREMQAD